MKRRVAFAGLISLTVIACNGNEERSIPAIFSTVNAMPVTELLYPVASNKPGAAWPQPALKQDPIVMPDCRLSVIDKQEVPSQREGVLAFIGTEIQPGETVPPDRLITVQVGTQIKQYRRLKEDDVVQAGQLLAQLDDRLARDDFAIKNGKVIASKAELAASEKTRDEAKSRLETQMRVRGTAAGAVPEEELRSSRLTLERYVYECVSRKEAVGQAELERNQAQTLLDMHQIRSSIPGVIKTIFKRPGEAVRAFEPVLQIQRIDRLRIEGMIETEYLPRLRKGMRAVVEPTTPQSPEQSFRGHLQEITSVAVSQDSTMILSGSEDGTVRVWQRSGGLEQRILHQPAPVRCLACTPAGAAVNWCLTGSTDGKGRIWDLRSDVATPLRELAGRHRGPITSVAFSPDGQFCATGSDDREVCIWESTTGNLRYRFPAGHRAAITSLQFAPQCQLLSAARDNTLRLWALGTNAAQLLHTIDRRSGDLAHPGISPDGSRLLLDQGKALRLLQLPDCRTEAILENGSEAMPFTTFALFSPDAQLILTTGPADGRLQLWRSATANTRPYELRRYVSRDRSTATCAAFAADGSFVVTGSKDRNVYLWRLPSRQEIEQQLFAEITLVDLAVESSDRHIRIWAEIGNPDRALLPGTQVTLTAYPGL